MNEPISTKDKLLTTARALFWTRGYSNVSVRDITKGAGVDAALVSRYFGGKRGLFEATLADIPTWTALQAEPQDVLDAAVESFSQPFDPEVDQANPFTMLLANVIDPEMGDPVRKLFEESLLGPLTKKLEEPHARDRATMLLSVLFGMALIRKSFQIEPRTEDPLRTLRSQLQYMALAALQYEPQEP